MRELSLQEVTHISGADASSTDAFVQDSIKWLTGVLSGYGTFQSLSTAPATGELAYSLPLLGLDIGKWGVAGFGGLAAAAAGYVIGKLLTDHVVKPYA